jgi:translation initiation factor 1 (eIF-1/SUI1)
VWLVSNHPELADGIQLDGTEQLDEDLAAKPTASGKVKKQDEQEVVISTVARNKRKYTTSITGLFSVVG